MLFRKGFLRVVICTGTLALGINMPTRTSVFAGDSVYLTALNYRQASGRAGRRGFDNLGNVVFHGLSRTQVNRLISSKLPSLLGHFPISTTLILRLFILLHNSGQADFAKRMIQSLLTQNRLILGGTTYEAQILHHLRFSIEFLRRQRLIGVDGKPLNFAGMISHLYYSENSAFALHTLLCSGYLQQLCENVQKKPRTTAMRLMHILAHLFGRESARPGVSQLPQLPKSCIEVLERENAQILNIYTSYVKTFARGNFADKPDTKLPFTETEFGAKTGTWEQALPSPTARSPFIALSNHDDNFKSVDDLASSVRNNIFIETSSIPSLPTTMPNSYLYAFYRHGDINKLEKENDIKRSDVWFKLKDFSLILATIEAGLMCFLRDGPGASYEFMGDEVGGEEGVSSEVDKEGEDAATEEVDSALGEEEGWELDVDVNAEDDEVDIGPSGIGRPKKNGEDDWVTGEPRQQRGYENVWRAFKFLQNEFEAKFREMWA